MDLAQAQVESRKALRILKAFEKLDEVIATALAAQQNASETQAQIDAMTTEAAGAADLLNGLRDKAGKVRADAAAVVAEAARRAEQIVSDAQAKAAGLMAEATHAQNAALALKSDAKSILDAAKIAEDKAGKRLAKLVAEEKIILERIASVKAKALEALGG